MLRKRRTREHIIADLAVHHVEGFVLRQGWTVERFLHDYGYDLNLFTYNQEGEVETESVLIQVKATDKMRRAPGGHAILFVVEVRDLLLWLRERLPVILVIYDAPQDTAYWLHVQGYFQTQAEWESRIYITLTVPEANRLSSATLEHFRDLKESAFTRLFGRELE